MYNAYLKGLNPFKGDMTQKMFCFYAMSLSIVCPILAENLFNEHPFHSYSNKRLDLDTTVGVTSDLRNDEREREREREREIEMLNFQQEAHRPTRSPEYQRLYADFLICQKGSYLYINSPIIEKMKINDLNR